MCVCVKFYVLIHLMWLQSSYICSTVSHKLITFSKLVSAFQTSQNYNYLEIYGIALSMRSSADICVTQCSLHKWAAYLSVCVCVCVKIYKHIIPPKQCVCICNVTHDDAPLIFDEEHNESGISNKWNECFRAAFYEICSTNIGCLYDIY